MTSFYLHALPDILDASVALIVTPIVALLSSSIGVLMIGTTIDKG